MLTFPARFGQFIPMCAVAWTVAELAKRAGMSRSAFATHFVSTIGCAPIEYLSRWRMSLAQDALSHGGKSLDDLKKSATNPPVRSAPPSAGGLAARRERLPESPGRTPKRGAAGVR